MSLFYKDGKHAYLKKYILIKRAGGGYCPHSTSTVSEPGVKSCRAERLDLFNKFYSPLNLITKKKLIFNSTVDNNTT